MIKSHLFEKIFHEIDCCFHNLIDRCDLDVCRRRFPGSKNDRCTKRRDQTNRFAFVVARHGMTKERIRDKKGIQFSYSDSASSSSHFVMCHSGLHPLIYARISLRSSRKIFQWMRTSSEDSPHRFIVLRVIEMLDRSSEKFDIHWRHLLSTAHFQGSESQTTR